MSKQIKRVTITDAWPKNKKYHLIIETYFFKYPSGEMINTRALLKTDGNLVRFKYAGHVWEATPTTPGDSILYSDAHSWNQARTCISSIKTSIRISTGVIYDCKPKIKFEGMGNFLVKDMWPKQRPFTMGLYLSLFRNKQSVAPEILLKTDGALLRFKIGRLIYETTPVVGEFITVKDLSWLPAKPINKLKSGSINVANISILDMYDHNFDPFWQGGDKNLKCRKEGL